MAKVSVYFQDLSDEKKEELWEYLREQLKDEIDEELKNENGIDRGALENEIIDNYINTHNLGMGFEL